MTTAEPRPGTLQRGDKLYSAFNGKLEVVTFLEEGLADPECTINAWLIRHANGQKARCSMDMYFRTEREAWEDYLRDWTQAIPGLRKTVNEALDVLHEASLELARVQRILQDIDHNTPTKERYCAARQTPTTCTTVSDLPVS